MPAATAPAAAATTTARGADGRSPAARCATTFPMNARISGPPWPAIYDRDPVLFFACPLLRPFEERPLLELDARVRLDEERPLELPDDDERLLALGDDCLRPLEEERFRPPDDDCFFWPPDDCFWPPDDDWPRDDERFWPLED